MVQVNYPGVYIQEKPSGVRTITGVATSIAAFVGFTRKGVPDKAVMITSFADFERGYGGLDRDSPVSYAVRQFFANGGTQALIVRVAPGSTPARWTLKDTPPATTPPATAINVLDVFASSPGVWGNNLQLTVDTDPANVRNKYSDFNLVVAQLQPDNTVVTIETHRNLSMNSKSAQYVESVVNNASAAIRVSRLIGPLDFTQAGFAVSAEITFPLPIPPSAVIGGTIDGTTPFLLTLKSTTPPWDNIAELVASASNAINETGLDAKLLASSSGTDGTGTGNCLKLTSKAAGETSSVVIAAGPFGGLAAKIGIGLANGGGEFPGERQHRPAPVSNPTRSASGADGSPGTATNLIGSEADKKGMQALLDVDLFNLLVIPETFDMTGGQEASLIAAAIKLCEDRRAFYIADAPSNRTLDDIAGWIAPSRNAATYFPAVRIPDPLDSMRPRTMAPSGTLAGVYARTDATRGVWKAPAGTDATLNNVVGLARPISDLENGPLNQRGVNVLRNFPVYGRVAWGARTMKGADAQADEYKYIPIRRLALFIEESLYRGTQWVVFEPNDEPLWAQIRLNLGVFMSGLFRQGAFQGSTPQEAYYVKCDKETTTQADRNLGIVNIEVGFAPLKPAEFVVITIQQIAGDLK